MLHTLREGMEIAMKKNAFRTKDLAEAAALDASGLSPINLEPGPDGRSVLFVFAEPAQAQELSRRFWSGQLHISARTYSDSLRRLKDRLFSNGRRA